MRRHHPSLEAEIFMTKLLSLLAVFSLAATLAFGQAADRPASAQDANAPTATRTDDTPRNDHNWGWIGLFGLLGLGGLAGRRKSDIRDRDRDVTRMRPAA
jgi:MYXO-CTERM domain-containing protein